MCSSNKTLTNPWDDQVNSIIMRNNSGDLKKKSEFLPLRRKGSHLVYIKIQLVHHFHKLSSGLGNFIMRLEIYWFGKFPQLLLSSKSSASQWGKAHWRQMNRPWVRNLVMQTDFNPGCTFSYTLFNQVCVCEIFVFPKQCSGLIQYIFPFFDGVFHVS